MTKGRKYVENISVGSSSAVSAYGPSSILSIQMKCRLLFVRKCVVVRGKKGEDMRDHYHTSVFPCCTACLVS